MRNYWKGVGAFVDAHAASGATPWRARPRIRATTRVSPTVTQVPLAVRRIPEGFALGENLFLENRQPGARDPRAQLDRGAFAAAVRPLVERMEAFQALRESAFLAEFGAH